MLIIAGLLAIWSEISTFIEKQMLARKVYNIALNNPSLHFILYYIICYLLLVDLFYYYTL